MQQLSLIDDYIQPEFVKDSECSINTPIIRGLKDEEIYGEKY